MSFIKKYSMLLIPVGVVLVAVVLIAVTILTNRSLASQIQTGSVSAESRIRSLINSAVSGQQWEAEKVRQDALEGEANAVVQLARQASMRELISYRIFPEPTDSSQQVFDEFGTRYRQALEQMVRGMNAMEAPSEMEIGSEIGVAATGPSGSLFSNRTTTPAYNPYGRTSPAARRSQADAARQAMIDAVCARRAEQIAVYANPTVFRWYEFWSDFKFPGKDLALVDCWNAQVAFWIYEDVAATINALNTGSQNVYASPVKRLLGVTFTEEADYPDPRQNRMDYTDRSYGRGSAYALGGQAGGLGPMPGDAPEYIQYPQGGILGVPPWTARLCNDDIDVVHFSVGVIVASSKVMPFMKELCRAKEHTWRTGYKENGAPQTGEHNQITVLSSEVIPVDPEAPENVRYRYGNEAVVRLNLICEYLFNRFDAYDNLKPEKIKEYLGQAAAGQNQTQQTGAAVSRPTRSASPAPSGGRRSSGRTIDTDGF